MATLQDVAKKAGVATMTVSRVVNRTGYISQATIDRVESAIAELGYEPNTLARSLRSKKTNTLALVVTDINNPFFTQLARGVEDVASSAGYMVIFGNTDESVDKEQTYLRMLFQKQVDGILLVPAQSAPASVEAIRRKGTPMVVLDRWVPGIQADIVRSDSEAGAYELTRYLIDLGHQRIAILTGPRTVSTAEDRVNGFRRALSAAGLPADYGTVLYGEFNQASGVDMVRQTLSSYPLITAILAANNLIAIGALKELREQGRRVPQEISLVGFDDLPQPLVTFPFLTVVSQPAYDMGRQAAELLLYRMEHPDEPYQEIILPCELIVRQSSAAPTKFTLE
jgi:LacI family transcriptional regulator